MQFKVTGADRTTGELSNRTIEAKSAAEAEAVASFTMLVSEVVPEEAPPTQTVPYAVPVARERFAGVNWERGIRFYAGVLRILGYALGLLGVWVVLASLWSAFRSLTAMMSLEFVLSENGLAFLDGLLLISAAVFLQLVSLIALAVRDIAVRANQVREKPAEPQDRSQK